VRNLLRWNTGEIFSSESADPYGIPTPSDLAPMPLDDRRERAGAWKEVCVISNPFGEKSPGSKTEAL